jgi:hypothetical protein
VIEAGGAALENGRDHHDARPLRDAPQGLGARPGHRLGEVELAVVLALAEVQRPEQLGQAHHLGPGVGGRLDLGRGAAQVVGGIGRHRHLDQADLEAPRRHTA